MHKRFETLADEDVIKCIRQGQKDALEYLIAKYKIIALAKAKTYFIVGADREDIVQEGMIGLFKAVRDYKDDKNASFRVFAELCITRQIITAIKTATRQKHKPLNDSISIYRPLYNSDEDDKTLVDTLVTSEIIEPEQIILQREKQKYLEAMMSEVLSDLELQVLSLYLEGQTYIEISEQLNRQTKTIDNALQRVKRKLMKHIELTEIM